MKRILLFCLSSMFAIAMWAADFVEDGIYYNITSETDLTVETTYTGSSNKDDTTYSGDIFIPATVTHEGTTYKVTSVGTYSFYNGSGITSISIAEGITSTGTYAFYGCSAITEVTIPESLTSIGNYTFNGCTSLVEATLGSHVTTMGTNVFNGCTALMSITSKNSTPPEVSNKNAFSNVDTDNCVVYVPTQSVDAYKEADKWSAFENIVGFGYTFSAETKEATDITNTSATLNGAILTTEDTGTVIEQGFAYWPASGEVTTVKTEVGDEMSATITGLEIYTDYTFCAYAKTESEIVYGNGVEFTTRQYDFSVDGVCYLIQEDGTLQVTYGGASTTAGTDTYVGEITIPATVTYDGDTYTVKSINDHAFRKCPDLTKVIIDADLTSIGEYAFYQCTGLKEINLPDNVTSIKSCTFQECSAMEVLTLPKNLESIGNNAIRKCQSLTTLTLPETLTSIGTYAFYQCEALTEINIPEGITEIGQYDFYLCAFSEITLPSKLTDIGKNAFQSCKSLVTVVSLNPEPPTCGDKVFDGVNTACKLFVPSESKETYAYADTWKDFSAVLAIGEPILTTLEATDVTSMNATLNGTIETIDNTKELLTKGFEYWTDEEDKKVVEVDAIGDVSVTITDLDKKTQYTYHVYATTEDGPSYGKDLTFTTADRNSDFYVDGINYNYGTDEGTCVVTYETEDYNTYSGVVNVPEIVTYRDVDYTVVGIGASAFRASSQLTGVIFPETVSSIGVFAFYECTALGEVAIPDAVAEVSNQAFNGCTSLTKVTIGSGVTSIGTSTFSSCVALAELYCLSPEPPTCGNNAFNGIASDAVLYVPCGSEDAYSEADTWGGFSTIVGIDCEPTTFDYTLDPEEGEVSSLHNISISYDDGVQLNVSESKWGDAKVYDANGDEVVEVIIATPIGTYGQTYTGYNFTIGLDGSSQDVTDAGDYYFVIPEGYISFYDSANDTWVECEQIIAHYVIEGEGSANTGTFICDVDPADGTKVTKLDQIIFTNPSGGEIFIGEEIRNPEINVYDEGGDIITQVTNFYTDYGDNWEEWAQIAVFGGSDDDGNVYPSEITAEGTYYVSVPANVFFIYDEGGNLCYNESMSLTYTVSADAGTENPDYTLSFSPEDGSTLDVLSTITISCEDGITQVLMPDEEITITDDSGNTWSGSYTITEVANDLGIVTQVVITLSQEIVEAGTYYVNVPWGYFDINQHMNEAFTLTYTITGAGTGTGDGIGGISINDENVEGIYSVGGQKLNSTQKGVNIVRYNDGTVKKIYIK